MSRALFLVLDGVDGAGKTTQAERLVAALVAERPVAPLHLREPGSTALGERLRALLLGGEVDPVPAAEALLFAAARRQMLEELVAPALAEGRDVVCERFHASTFAYQSAASGVDGDAVLALLHTWCGAPAPDLEFLLLVDPAQARTRRGGDRDRIERRGLDFQMRVAAGMARYATLTPRARVLDGARAADAVAADIEREVRRARL